MSEQLKHECGIVLIRLLKPLSYYVQKYNTPLYGFQKLFLLMEKQHNRGQDGAGIGCCKIDMPPGEEFMFRQRSISTNALAEIFSSQYKSYSKLLKKSLAFEEFPKTIKEKFDFGGEILMGHLRYGTSGNYSKNACHPFFRHSAWPTRNLMLAGNFTMTNSKELNKILIHRGIHPVFNTDTQAILEEICFHLGQEHSSIYRKMRDEGIHGFEIQAKINKMLPTADILKEASKSWEGGYVIAGTIGNGDSFVMRDPAGIRPAHYYKNDEIIAFASERVALMTAFDVTKDDVQEVKPAHICVVKADGTFTQQPFTEPKKNAACSFERIYFSRGNDPDIYRERKKLGALLVPQVLKAVNNDISNTVVSFIPNTAEIAYYGFSHTLRLSRRQFVKDEILRRVKENEVIDEKVLDELIMDNWPIAEKIPHKDIKLRTFISNEKSRTQLASHVYDITYDVVKPEHYLICIDDSIVRGTTLKQSILRILSRTCPKKIIIASTAPQIRYPDCYGIDMSELGKFCAFQAAVALCEETGASYLIKEVYNLCCKQSNLPAEQMKNYVSLIYDRFTDDQISKKISEMVYPKNLAWKGEIELVFQSIENLHKALPETPGDWYFSGNYPTSGGYAVLNRAFINYYENSDARSY